MHTCIICIMYPPGPETSSERLLVHLSSSREGVSRTALHDHSMHSTARSVASLGPWQPWHDWIWWKTHRPRGVCIFDIWCTPRGPHGLQRNQPYFCCHNHLRLTGLNCCLRWYLFPTALWLKSSLSHWASSIYTYFLYWVTPSYSLPRPNCDLPLSKTKALQAKGDGSKPDPTNEGSASYDTILRCNELCMKLKLVNLKFGRFQSTCGQEGVLMVIDVQPCPTMEPHLPRPSCHCGSCELGAHTNAVHQTEMLVIYVKWKGRRVMSLTPSSFKTCTLCIPKSHRVKRCQKCDSAQVSVSLSPVLPQILPSPRLTEGSWTNRSEQNWLSKLNTYHEVTGFLRRHCLKHDMRKFSGGCKGTC